MQIFHLNHSSFRQLTLFPLMAFADVGGMRKALRLERQHIHSLAPNSSERGVAGVSEGRFCDRARRRSDAKNAVG